MVSMPQRATGVSVSKQGVARHEHVSWSTQHAPPASAPPPPPPPPQVGLEGAMVVSRHAQPSFVSVHASGAHVHATPSAGHPVAGAQQIVSGYAFGSHTKSFVAAPPVHLHAWPSESEGSVHEVWLAPASVRHTPPQFVARHVTTGVLATAGVPRALQSTLSAQRSTAASVTSSVQALSISARQRCARQAPHCVVVAPANTQ
jgi:hypothetical protein